ncbi:hypothetical protein [Luteolibacter luteus]|uniref:Polysaccharide chain length determinant N-terminal domain-containing protein n=1 Tax=Luteolibacter luteus TaxID=2728835 RepID=A0A858RBW5_9BACT|nr:hypothetical protein [Luteolibacter luteus]QJE94257.1 hypothetical protein HHL09_00140 [Luteolibacter luteus]
MNPDTHPWKKMAAAARRSGEGHAPSASASASPSAPAPTAEIAWLPELPEKIHAMFLRLIWRRWSIAAILISAAVMAAAWFHARGAFSADHDAVLPRIPIPAAP